MSDLKDRERNKTLKVHEKLTHNQKLIEGMKSGLKPDISDDEMGDDDDDIGNLSNFPVKEDRSWTIAVTRDRRIEKESLKDYINKKREMFLVQVIENWSIICCCFFQVINRMFVSSLFLNSVFIGCEAG